MLSSRSLKTTTNVNPCIALEGNAANQGDLTYFEDGALISLIRFDRDANGATLTFDDRTSGQAVERMKITGDGTLYAREVRVTQNTFPDYVFSRSLKTA